MEEKLKELMAGIFDLKKEDIKEDSAMSNIETWDSLSHLQLIAGIEEKFGISIDVDDILKMTSFSEIRTILTSKGVKA